MTATKQPEPKALPAIIPAEMIGQRIYWLRGQKVMLDSDLAELYEVETRVLMQSAKRNIERFPEDFMFQLTEHEVLSLRSQFVTTKNDGNQDISSLRSQIVILKNKSKRGQHSKYLPYAFTEQDIAMLSSVLRSKRAVQVNIAIMRAFVQFRAILASHKDLAKRLDKLESKYDEQFAIVFQAIRELMEPPSPPKKHPIGFGRDEEWEDNNQ